MTGRLRGFGRWLSDWRTGAVVVASVLVALLAVVVVDSIQARRASDARADRTLSELEITVEELQRRGIRIDELAAQLEEASTGRAQLAEEVRALRELLIDQGVIEPRPQQTGNSTSAGRPESTRRPTTGPGAAPRPTPQPGPSPRPSASPSPSPSPSPCVLRDPLTGACLIPPPPRAHTGR